MSGSLGLCMATYDITDTVLGTFDLSEPLARIVGDGIFDLSGFCKPWSKASRMCVPVCRDVHFWSFGALRCLCRRLLPQNVRSLSF